MDRPIRGEHGMVRSENRIETSAHAINHVATCIINFTIFKTVMHILHLQ